ncbi:MAG: 2Fe-2S iron-sulfur cluster binding domain-containing protein [Bacteroidetes bacterium]|jgi:[NiFe] hydrogenase diaphorase moiety small subunit|nr:2Fe-2S iron-sulfur cluster binding domain-containing protein [Bacteroidota bacterium]
MAKFIKFTIDGEECMAQEGKYVVDAARENGIYIPTLCNVQGIKPKGACRICSVKINGRLMTACTTPVTDGMIIENDHADIQELRKSIIELLFVEGNHLCPSCEKSGSCELQALAYRFEMMVPRFPYFFPLREIDASHPKIIKDHNRCILCKRCIRVIKDKDGKNIFAFRDRGHHTGIYIDPELADNLTDELADKAADICPVGAILKRESGFKTPIGNRKYDQEPIGADVEKINPSNGRKKS